MYTLALDTTGYKIHLVLLKNDTLLFERDWKANMNEDETITKTMQHLLEVEPFFTQKLTKCIINQGPGTLTGTRVGVTMINALVTATGASLVKLTSQDIWPLRLHEEHKKRKPHLLLRITEQELFCDGKIVTLAELTKKCSKGQRGSFVAYGELTPTQFSQLNKLRSVEWIIETELLPFAGAMQKITDKGDKKLASPLYARPPVITESKKKQLVTSMNFSSMPDYVPTPKRSGGAISVPVFRKKSPGKPAKPKKTSKKMPKKQQKQTALPKKKSFSSLRSLVKKIKKFASKSSKKSPKKSLVKFPKKKR